MRTSLLAVMTCLSLVGPNLAQNKEKPFARRIVVTDLKIGAPEKQAGPMTPAIFVSFDELAKSPVLKDAAEDLKKRVDFAKEKLVVFSWTGRPKEAVGATALQIEDKKATVIFTYTSAGATKGSQQHTFVYAVPKDVEIRVERGKAPK